MSYFAQYQISTDPDLQARIIACAATEGISAPEQWAHQHRHTLAANPGWADAYKYAQNTNNQHPGQDETVITDLQILTAVQTLHAQPDPTVPEETLLLQDRIARLEHQQTMTENKLSQPQTQPHPEPEEPEPGPTIGGQN